MILKQTKILSLCSTEQFGSERTHRKLYVNMFLHAGQMADTARDI
jgi:hypothetical protein